jgi:hypothetical protein
MREGEGGLEGGTNEQNEGIERGVLREQRKRGEAMAQLQEKGNEEITVEGKYNSQGGGGGGNGNGRGRGTGKGRRCEAMRHFFVWSIFVEFFGGYFCGFCEEKKYFCGLFFKLLL